MWTRSRFALLVLVPALFVGCEPGGASSSSPQDWTGTAGRRPSGSLIRWFNGYVPTDGRPMGDIEVYLNAEGIGFDTKVTVPLGTVSSPYDPRIDDRGEAALSVYPSTGQEGERVIVQHSWTPRPGETRTFFLGATRGPDGASTGSVHEFVHAIDEPTQPGKGTVDVDLLLLQKLSAPDEGTAWYFGVDGTCASGYRVSNGAIESTDARVTPDEVRSFALPPGMHAGGLHLKSDCSDPPFVGESFEIIREGAHTVFAVYTTTVPARSDTLRVGVVPLVPVTAPAL
ncbi:hypothetical protein AKJ09_03365 [Labilithrix luteola]|uniref:Lipoprotein n=1 Tax=Labilithrix luteola TaxID=1391654 RepID=A0A0K1PTJ6_9BACT|nr:hypothetical protein [Labilithrix luteola]AKU96701.1 hypothetical protein AKJ09_03365 [Labilithrix luteola]